MKIYTKEGLYPPEEVDWDAIRERGYMMVMYCPSQDTAELLEDSYISVKSATIAAVETNLEMMILTWE